jgi:hypothetical protein
MELETLCGDIHKTDSHDIGPHMKPPELPRKGIRDKTPDRSPDDAQHGRPLDSDAEHQGEQQVYPQFRVGEARHPVGLYRQEEKRIDGYLEKISPRYRIFCVGQFPCSPRRLDAKSVASTFLGGLRITLDYQQFLESTETNQRLDFNSLKKIKRVLVNGRHRPQSKSFGENIILSRSG